jgi:hypothetical protein
LTFDDQINSFKKTKGVITAKLGEAAANKHFNEAMYFIGLGNTSSHTKKYFEYFLLYFVFNVKNTLNSPNTLF